MRFSLTLWKPSILLFSIWAASCVADTGIVMDKVTSKPIAGAHVVVAWRGVMVTPVQDQSICYDAQATITDENGRFEISGLSGNVNPLLLNRNRSIQILAPGYKVAPGTDRDALRFLMEPESGTTSEQFKRLPSPHALGCPIADKKELLPFLRALHQEMTRLAATVDERKRASNTLFEVESIQLGDQEAYRRANDRERAAMKGAP
jgi:hypothetical protein